MSSNTSATRVKAYRSRLSKENLRRVEAYVSSDEKALIDLVRSAQNTTADGAVAGLVRLGLSAYAAQASSMDADHPESVALVAPEVLSLLHPAPSSRPEQVQSNPIAQFFQKRKDSTNAK